MTENTLPIEEILIIRYGEVALKGMNKSWFERILLGRLTSALARIPEAKDYHVQRDNGLFTLRSADGKLGAGAVPVLRRILKVFGVSTVSRAILLHSTDMADICAACAAYMREKVLARGAGAGAATATTATAGGPLTFKVYGKRSDKTYPVSSPEMSARAGAAVLAALGDAVKVDVHNPGVHLFVHLRLGGVFIYDEKEEGFGGLPLGTNGRGLILLSGGIDSPVAAWLMAKRGMRIEAVHFHSYPYTSERAREKVEELAAILAGYCGNIRMHIINLLPAQEAIGKHCPEELMTILVRRFMMKIAERVAQERGLDMLITGENLGQVASQTAEALVTTDEAVRMPVMRPLIALDKTDIIEKAEEIGTFEKSIEPYEDCCTVFLPRHPATRPSLAQVLEAEARIPDMEALLARLTASAETVVIKPEGGK
ncbi:MAG: tRNA 4-thiouridine(8) synthase ThiI [Clostridiales Family XIII bacterium]|jgi:thiamine biosynthesis protein ThiI|nr:tRNA 4-thiouridine(8) synthase ThiI [Clostridiales Family XIII bacterium]